METQEEMIIIATFSRPMEAHLTKSRLESEGIECFLDDELTVAANWLFSNAIGGVKLKVKESDAKKASEILRQEPIDIDLVEFDEDIEADEDRLQCPRCNSFDVYYEKYSRRTFFLFWMLLGIPFPFSKRKWVCKGCGHEWKARGEGISR